jgi:hypothetical protein
METKPVLVQATPCMEGRAGCRCAPTRSQKSIPRPYGELTDQLRPASLSIVANLAERVGKEGNDQSRFVRIARFVAKGLICASLSKLLKPMQVAQSTLARRDVNS